MSGITPSQPQNIILNSKHKRSGENNGDVLYELQTPIQGAQRARLHDYSTVYLINLIRPEQASLTFDISGFSYNVSLTSLTSNYYTDIADVVTDIQGVIDGLFVDSSGQYHTAIKPTLAYAAPTRSVSFSGSSAITINASNSTFWFKLGWPNGTYGPALSLTAPSYPNVIPVTEVYIELQGFLNTGALIRTSDSSYHGNPNIADIVTFDCGLGDVFSTHFATIPEYPLQVNNTVGQIRVRLLDSTGAVITNMPDYRIVISFDY